MDVSSHDFGEWNTMKSPLEAFVTSYNPEPVRPLAARLEQAHAEGKLTAVPQQSLMTPEDFKAILARTSPNVPKSLLRKLHDDLVAAHTKK